MKLIKHKSAPLCWIRPTCSPVALFLASFTLPMLPAPMVFPRAHVPVFGAEMVVRRLGGGADGAVLRLSVVTPLMGIAGVAMPLVGIADVVEASEAYLEWPARVERWVLLVESVLGEAGTLEPPVLSREALRREEGAATLDCSKSLRATLARWAWGDAGGGRPWP